MPEYLSPGVYVEEVDAGPKPIEGVSTSTAGAVGVTVRGPTAPGRRFGKPVLVTSFAEFERIFGGYLPVPDDAAVVNQWSLNPAEGGRWWLLPLAVKGFFDNGGQRLYLKRVFSDQWLASTADVGVGVVSELEGDAPATATQLRLRHRLGIEVGSQVDIFSAGQGLPGNPFTVTGYDSASGQITVNNPVGVELREGRDFVEINTRSVTPLPDADVTLTFTAKARGTWGDDLRVQVRPMVGSTLDILHDPGIGGDAATTTVRNDAAATDPVIDVADSTDFAVNDHVLINGREYNVDAVPAADQITIAAPGVPAGQTWGQGTMVRRLRPANTAAAAATIRVDKASRLYENALVELDNGTQKEILSVVSVSEDVATFSGNLANTYYEGHKIRVIEAEVGVEYRRDNVVQADERFTNLRLTDDGSMSYLVTHINERSMLVDVQTGINFSDSNFDDFPCALNGRWEDLANGSQDYSQLTVDDFVGTDGGSGHRTGIQALEDIDEIAICLAPNMWSQTIRNALIQHCETLKDRFAILDSRDGLGVQGIRDFREPIDTKYAGLYYPWIEVRDPLSRLNVLVAPSGHMAGIYARVDVERGVHKAPANEVIRGITRIAQDITKREHDMLNPKNINVLRYFAGRGNRVWGARVVTSDAAWKYINVRRLFIFVEESIDEGTQWVVFEPNDEPLWARVRQTITRFLTTVWRSGALQGATSDEAFFVRCDRSTMTQDDIDNGRLICVIGIAPVKPAEFVIFRIQQKTLGAES